MKHINNRELLEMALVGYAQRKAEIQVKIDDINQQLTGAARPGPVAVETPTYGRHRIARRGKRVLSASARRRIGLAQKKRWAEHRKLAKSA